MLAQPKDPFAPHSTLSQDGPVDKPAMTPRAQAPVIIDLVHLSRQTFGDPELERDVLNLFANQAKECGQALLCTTNPKELSRLAHLIKGSARGVGACDLAQKAEQVEQNPSSLTGLQALATSLASAQERAEDLMKP